MQDFTNVLKVDKNHIQALVGKADCLKQMKKIKEALNYYTQAMFNKKKPSSKLNNFRF